MINIESQIFSYVAERVRAEYPDAYITGEYVRTPPKFPAISLIETENEVYRNGRDTNIENYASVFYEVNVYSNKKTGKKSECKEIASFIDDCLSNLNLTRILFTPVPNLEDASIFRITSRYRAIVSKNEVIYRR